MYWQLDLITHTFMLLLLLFGGVCFFAGRPVSVYSHSQADVFTHACIRRPACLVTNNAYRFRFRFRVFIHQVLQRGKCLEKRCAYQDKDITTLTYIY